MSPLPFLRRLGGDRAGAAAVETAMILPALLLILLGTVEVGRMAWTRATLTYAVQEAARCASVNHTACGTVDQIQTFAAAKASALDVDKASFAVAQNLGCGTQVSADVTRGFMVYKLAPSAPHITAQVCRP